MDESTILQVRNLEVLFQSEKERTYAVNNISLDLHRGEILGIVGESGCGKSVSMMSLLGLLPDIAKVTNGTALYQGKDLLKCSQNELSEIRGNEIGMIFQDPIVSFNPVYTIGKQLMEPLIIHQKLSKAEARKKACEMLELVGISNAGERLKAYPHQFSGGMRQRAMIAMALICNPSVLIADEPTTALDVTIELQITTLIKKLQKELNMAIIWITHDLGLLAGLADRVAVMYGGMIIESGPVRSLYKEPMHPYTIGLLNSLPRIDEAYKRLESIEGTPPIYKQYPKECTFADRCRFCEKRCREAAPPLTDRGGGHLVACFKAQDAE